jgi:hypothetical protein
MVALGLPLSIGLGGWVADLISGAPSPPEPADAALAAKVGRQFLRMGLFLAAFMGLAAAACAFLLDRH